MNEFKESNNSGRYASGVPYTPFHREGQVWDRYIGVNVVKTAFWRLLTYFSVFIGLFFAIILISNIYFSYSPLQIIEVSKKGKVLFWGELEKSPIVIKDIESKKLASKLDADSIEQWQIFLDKYINGHVDNEKEKQS